MAVYMLLVVQCLLIFQPVLSQTIVDSELCDRAAINCGTPDGPASEKYCCVESNGGLNLIKCCNPYIGLIIGLSIGIPAIVAIIVAVITLYCCCAHYQNKKMARMAVAYSRRRNRQDQDVTLSLAPPAYTSTDHTKSSSDSDLPSYTVTDPYTSLQTAPPPSAPSMEGQGSAPTAEEEAADTTHLQVTIGVPEDIPLLRNEEH